MVQFRLLTEADVKTVLTMDDLIETMASALQRFSTGRVVQPVRSVIAVDGDQAFFATMPAFVEGMRRHGFRVSLREIDAWVASFRHDPMVSDDGVGSAPTPWGAVQAAAWAALKPSQPRFG